MPRSAVPSRAGRLTAPSSGFRVVWAIDAAGGELAGSYATNCAGVGCSDKEPTLVGRCTAHRSPRERRGRGARIAKTVSPAGRRDRPRSGGCGSYLLPITICFSCLLLPWCRFGAGEQPAGSAQLRTGDSPRTGRLAYGERVVMSFPSVTFTAPSRYRDRSESAPARDNVGAFDKTVTRESSWYRLRGPQLGAPHRLSGVQLRVLPRHS